MRAFCCLLMFLISLAHLKSKRNKIVNWKGLPKYHMAENFGHLSPRGSSGSSQSIIKMAYEITELCMRREWFTENTRTTNAIFQFAKIENHSVIFQLYFSWKTYGKNEFHTFHSERYRFATSDPVKALETPADPRQNNHRLHIVQRITKNRTTLHNLPKSIHKI